MKNIGERLYKLRKSFGLSRKEIENRFGISSNTLKIWESGKHEIGVMKLMNYLKIFRVYDANIDLTYFLEYVDKDSEINPYQFALKKINSITDAINKTMKYALRDIEYMFYAVFNNINLNIAIKDDTHTILRINNSAASLLGGIPEDFQYKKCYDFFQNDSKHLVINDNLLCIKNNIIVENTLYSEHAKRELKIKNIPVIDQQLNKNLIIVILE